MTKKSEKMGYVAVNRVSARTTSSRPFSMVFKMMMCLCPYEVNDAKDYIRGKQVDIFSPRPGLEHNPVIIYFLLIICFRILNLSSKTPKGGLNPGSHFSELIKYMYDEEMN